VTFADAEQVGNWLSFTCKACAALFPMTEIFTLVELAAEYGNGLPLTNVPSKNTLKLPAPVVFLPTTKATGTVLFAAQAPDTEALNVNAQAGGVTIQLGVVILPDAEQVGVWLSFTCKAWAALFPKTEIFTLVELAAEYGNGLPLTNVPSKNTLKLPAPVVFIPTTKATSTVLFAAQAPDTEALSVKAQVGGVTIQLGVVTLADAEQVGNWLSFTCKAWAALFPMTEIFTLVELAAEYGNGLPLTNAPSKNTLKLPAPVVFLPTTKATSTVLFETHAPDTEALSVKAQAGGVTIQLGVVTFADAEQVGI
jgi:hypothetical protein